MGKNIWDDAQEIYDAISEYQGTEVTGIMARMLKLAEETGEASQVCINFLVLNKRKAGEYVTGQQVVDELCDVILTAMVALHDWSIKPPRVALEERVTAIADRVRIEGS